MGEGTKVEEGRSMVAKTICERGINSGGTKKGFTIRESGINSNSATQGMATLGAEGYCLGISAPEDVEDALVQDLS